LPLVARPTGRPGMGSMMGIHVGERLRWATIGLAVLLWAPGGRGADPPPTPLGIRQQALRQRVREMEETLVRLAEALRESEPENAERLLRAARLSKETLVGNKMADIARLLDQSKLETATREQRQVIEDLARLVRVLTEETTAEERRRRRIRQLEAWRKKLEELIAEQFGERRETEKVSERDAALAALAARIRRLEALLAEQKGVLAETRRSPAATMRDLAKVADRQKRVREDTERLAAEVAAAARRADGDPMGSEPGEKALRRATDHQAASENALAKGKPRSAAEDQEAAVAALRQALAEMKKESDRLRRLPPDHHRRMADQQKGTAGKTGDLHAAMSKAAREAAQEGGQPGGQQGGQQSGQPEPQPGQPQVEQARRAMERAEQDLRREDLGEAGKEQEKALERLKEARAELEQILAQLREEEQEEILAALEAYFREMLERQKPVTLLTENLDRTRAERPWARADRLKCAALAREEQALAELAQKVLDILVEEGTTVVFPRIVAGLRDDLGQVHRLLADEKTHAYTRTLQREIERTLEELIAALQKQRDEQAQRPQPPSQNPQQQQMPPLVDPVAELKMLRAAQMRINRLTRALDAQRRKDRLDPTLKRDIQRTAERQREVAEMTLEMIEEH